MTSFLSASRSSAGGFFAAGQRRERVERGEENLIRVALYILTTRSTDPADIAQALHAEGGYDGVGGTIAFDEQGRLTGRSPWIMVSEDGMFDFIEE